MPWVRTLALAIVPALLLPAIPAQADPIPHIRGTSTEPVHSYADAVRESVWVHTGLDSDNSGTPDRIAVDVVRPRARSKVPVVLEGSPYYACCGRGNEGELKGYDANGVISRQPLYYDNYFVPRGYAFVAADLAGTNRSTGCEDVGGRAEVLGARAVVDWLNGRARATYADGSPAVATRWSTGAVGMIGKSWDGSVANGVAATGVDGLKTIVPIAAISSWYDYQRYNGVLRSPDYPEFLHEVVSGRPAGVCAATIDALDTGSDDATGDHNAFWAERDYRPDAGRVKASVFVVHGLQDLNVTTSQFALWWKELAAAGVQRKIWLSQAGHVDPFDFRRADWVRTLHRWFDFHLYGLRNGIDREPQASIESAPGQWSEQSAWPAAAARPTRVSLGDGDGITGTLGGGPSAAERTWTDNPMLGEVEGTASPSTPVAGRVAFLSAPLTHAVRLSGLPTATLRVRVDQPSTELTARLVDYGVARRVNHFGPEEGITTVQTESCWGASTAADDACYLDTTPDVVTNDHAVLTRGWLDAAHHVSLRTRTPLRPDRWYTITVPLQATDQVVAAGHVLGLILQQSDNEFSSPSTSGATVRLDLRGSSLTLPLVGNLPQPAATAPVVTTAAASRVQRAPVVKRQLP